MTPESWWIAAFAGRTSESSCREDMGRGRGCAKRDGKYHPLSWEDAAASVSRLARGLAALGIEPGERVALVSENRPEWVIADLAIMTAGAVTVPAYVTNTVADHRHILGNSGERADHGADARRHRLHHLHFGHRRAAERGLADPPQHHRQLPRRLSPAREPR